MIRKKKNVFTPSLAVSWFARSEQGKILQIKKHVPFVPAEDCAC